MICPTCGQDHHAEVPDSAAVAAGDAAVEHAEIEAEVATERIESDEAIAAERIAADVEIAQIRADAETEQVAAVADAQVEQARIEADAQVEAIETLAAAIEEEEEPPVAEETEPSDGAGDGAPEPVEVPPQVQEEAGMAKAPAPAQRKTNAFHARRPKGKR